MLLWFHLVIPSFPARIDDMRSRFSALSAVRSEAHSGQTQKSNATSGFRRLELRKSLKRKPARLLSSSSPASVGKCYKNSTVRENYKLGGL